MTWSAKQYSAFENERTRPVRDLMAAIPPHTVTVAVDLGCGPGNSTEVLAQCYPSAKITGLDHSSEMVEAARARLPSVQFELTDIADWQSSTPMDVILANASLQWLPDHQTLYPKLIRSLAMGGCLAVQTPDNLDEPPHRLAREMAASQRWHSQIADVQHPERHTAAWYYALLKPLCTRVDVWRTTYFHVLPNHQAVVEWFKGAALRPYLAPLSAEEKEEFLKAYGDAIAQEMPALDDGSVLLPFPRLFIVATR